MKSPTLKAQTQTEKTADAPGRASPVGAPDVRAMIQKLVNEVGKVIVGKRNALELVATAVLTEGAHILFEDMPGLAKSVMAATFARASGCKFKRIQFTPDLLPADITGTYIYDQKQGKFDFHAGPIFSHFLLADEINRASPKTQSALLEAMAEKQVSIEGTTHKLERPFIVMATQNPIEQEGTYVLPEAQLDRFMIKASMGYPSLEEEKEILERRDRRQKDDFDVSAVLTAEDLQRLQKAVEQVRVQGTITHYIADLVTHTRHHPQILAGASPRGSLALLKLAKSRAALQGRTYVVPDDVRWLVEPVLAHRIILRPEAKVRGVKMTQVLREIVAAVPVPKV